MHRPIAVSVLTAAALCLLVAGVLPASAVAGQFTVASCQADRVNFSTTAFSDFATRGMTIRRACNPEGPGIRGLVTANATRRGSVPRGAVAMVAIPAPSGTSFASFRWAGSLRRSDCRYALQLYAEGPGIKPVAIKNVRANRGCAGSARTQAAGYRSRTFNVAGATRIVQRVICHGGDGSKSCSARGANYIRTYQAEVAVVDDQPPTATIAADTPLATGVWVSGSQPLHYDAHDNVGVRRSQAIAAGRIGGTDSRPCAVATTEGVYANAMPCPNGPGQISVQTTELAEGTQQLVVQSHDAAGNVSESSPVPVRIDNTAPGRVAVGVIGGDRWRNQNEFVVGWTNPAEDDRAPIAAAAYKLCAATGGKCTEGHKASDGISALPVEVPGPGEWTVAIWRRDQAGNANPSSASDPVTLRYDPEPPQLAFDVGSSSDPTLVAASVTDKVSGVADGAIEISAAGSNTWHMLETQKEASRLVARIDDAALPRGTYQLRASARDHARNEASTTLRSDGQPMMITLPLRAASTMRVGVARTRRVTRIVRRDGKRRAIQRRVTELRSRALVRFSRQVQIRGRLANGDGQGIAGAQVHVVASVDGAPEQLVGVVHTDVAGSFTYTAAGSGSRSLRFVYSGSSLILPAHDAVRLVVRAASTFGVSRRHVRNGHRVMFSGQVRSGPIPGSGKLVELQVLLSGSWQTFRTVRSDGAGRWAMPYRFARTHRTQWYRFRVKLPSEAGYPFAAGVSKSVRVLVKGG